jgi:Tol biopolymer transport system component
LSKHTATGRPWRFTVSISFADEAAEVESFDRYLKSGCRTSTQCEHSFVSRVTDPSRCSHHGLAPDFSDNGQLAYTSTAPNLVAGDADAFADVFVYDIATATNTRLQLTHINAAFNEAYGTAMSADGRFVAFTGYENDGAGTERWNVYAIDRELQASFDISVRTDRDPVQLLG